MTDLKQIPHLIKLLDDDSPEIRDRIVQELISFGPTLNTELRKVPFPLNSLQEESIRIVFENQKKVWLKQAWLAWVNYPSQNRGSFIDYQRLEKGVAILATFLGDTGFPEAGRRVVSGEMKLQRLLNSMALAYKKKFRGSDPKRLASFLFGDGGFAGDEEEYFDPQYNNLIHVIHEKKGIPISLTAVYMLVGRRLGLTIDGCHFPGHFLARFDLNDRSIYVDCFNDGQLLEGKDLLYAEEGIRSGIKHVLREKIDEEGIMRCLLANLVRSYQVEDDEENASLMITLFKDLDRRWNRRKMEYLKPEDIINEAKPCFKAGQLIYHKQYGYRGVIVEVNSRCEATDQWYYGNQTQPSRGQPWYHVLVDRSDQVTYVAESNLGKDLSGEKIDHPLLFHFFEESDNGRYIRNHNPWLETDL